MELNSPTDNTQGSKLMDIPTLPSLECMISEVDDASPQTASSDGAKPGLEQSPPQETSRPIETDSSRGWFGRSFSRMTVGGVRHSMLTLTSTALGGGVLSVSYVMNLAGVGLGTGMLAIGGGLAFLSLKLLMLLSHETGHSTYAGLLAHCAGPKAGPVLDALLFFYGNGSCISYMVFLGDFIPSLVSLGGSTVPAWLSSRTLAIVGSSLLMLPMALQRDISVLRYVAPVSILGLVYMALTVAIKAPSLYQEHQDDSTYGPLMWANPTIHLFDAFAICIFAFNCHLNVVPVAGSMVRPTRSRVVKVSARVNLLQLVFYCLIGITGYISFLAQTPGDIIKAYPAKDLAVVVGRLLLSCTMLVAIPVNLYPTVRSGLQIWDYLRGRPVPPPSPPASPRGGVASPSQSGPLSAATAGLRYFLTVLCLAGQAAVGILVPDVAIVIGLLGATVASLMMLGIPAYCLGVVMPHTAKTRLMQAVLYFFTLVCLASVPVKILTWTHVIN